MADAIRYGDIEWMDRHLYVALGRSHERYDWEEFMRAHKARRGAINAPMPSPIQIAKGLHNEAFAQPENLMLMQALYEEVFHELPTTYDQLLSEKENG